MKTADVNAIVKEFGRKKMDVAKAIRLIEKLPKQFFDETYHCNAVAHPKFMLFWSLAHLVSFVVLSAVSLLVIEGAALWVLITLLSLSLLISFFFGRLSHQKKSLRRNSSRLNI